MQGLPEIGKTSVDGGAAPNDKRTSVFLSYSRDDQPRALPVIKALEASGMAVWWDGLLEGGDAFARTTEAALEGASAVVVLWSARSVQSHWVRDEATRGRDRGCMVPVSIDGTEPPLGFRQIQYIDLSKWKGKASAPEFAVLVKAIRTCASSPHKQLTFAGANTPLRFVSRRRAMVLGGGALAAIGGGLAAWKTGLFGGGVLANSVAVLPFRNLSGDPAQSYFSDGLSEELRATLSRYGQLEVVAETSSNSFRDAKVSVQKIARALNVAFILEGSVRRVKDTIRITSQLIDGRTGFERWAQTFDRKFEDVLAVQSDIATLVADALAANITASTASPRERIGGTHDPAAFDAYLRGTALYKLAADEASDRGSLSQFDKALKIDPKFAAAHAARSRSLNVIASNYTPAGQMKGVYQQAVDAANAAIRNSPDMAEGYSALGFVLMMGRFDMKGARVPYQRSFELGFGNAAMLTAFADFAALNGQFAEGRRANARAMRLDPLNPTVFRNAGILEYAAHNYDAAVTPFRTALSLNPELGVVLSMLGDIELLRGNLDQALALYEKEPSEVSHLRGLAIATMRQGDAVSAQRHLAALVQKYGDSCLYQQCQVMAQWRRPGEALTALEKAYETGDAGVILSRNDPLLDPIRQDTRFGVIQERLGFV
jgi:TolB-like protein